MRKSNSTHFVHQTAKAALITTVALALLLPAGIVGADTTTTSVMEPAAISANEPSGVTPADPDKVKFTKDQAIAKLRELYPALKNATVSNVELGITNVFPAPENQMVWTIQWEYRNGNHSTGFSSQVDAINGDLISTYMYMPNQGNEAYYPPKLSKAQALETAKKFIAKAVTSVAASDIKLENNMNYYSNSSVLFGPVQYGFVFSVLKNGIPTDGNYIHIVVDANGNLIQFSKPSDSYEYPAATPAVTLAEANKKFLDEFDVQLSYTPIIKNNGIDKWILSWTPVEYSLYPIDALTGSKMDYEGKALSTAPSGYSDITQAKAAFQPRTSTTELTAEEAEKLVKEVATIPEGRTLNSKSLGNDYQNAKRKVWRLTWSSKDNMYAFGFPTQSMAEVDAATGEILQFQVEAYGNPDATKEVVAPAGASKLTKEAAKDKAIELVNRLYANASTELKLIEQGEDWSVTPDGKGYRYEFVRFFKGIPVDQSNVTLNLDLYGRLQNYYASRMNGMEKISDVPAESKITKKEAIEAYQSQYTTKLQYSRIGLYTGVGNNIPPKVKLVYASSPIDAMSGMRVLDSVTGKWVTRYNGVGTSETAATATDIKGHWAEKALSTLVEYNVIVPDAEGKVMPNQPITNGEWLTMITKASTPYYSGYYGSMEPKAVAGVDPESPDYEVVNYAAERQWISRDTTFQPEKELTRDQLALLLSSFVKYNKLSAYLEKDASVSKFSDAASIRNKGAVALVVKLGLMQGQSGKFQPQQTVTKAEAASVIMKLVVLQGKTDQPLGQ